jgi:type II secretory pathway pseudopilin PulG
MTVVVIVSVLATLAVYGTQKYIFAAKTSEAIHMIGLIKAGQESYKDETFSYLNISSSLTDLYPNPTPNKDKRMWGHPSDDWANWNLLSVHSDAPLQFGYACVAGAAGAEVPQPAFWAETFDWKDYATPNNVWYVVNAVADQDVDDTKSVYVSSSFQNQIFIQNEGE